MERLNGIQPAGAQTAPVRDLAQRRNAQLAAAAASGPPQSAGESEPVQERGRERNSGPSVQNVIGGHAIRLHVDEETQRIVAQVLDADNNVIRQIPPQEVLELARRFSELRGILFDQTA